MLDLGLDDAVAHKDGLPFMSLSPAGIDRLLSSDTGQPPPGPAPLTADAAIPMEPKMATVTMPMVQLTPEQQEEYRRMSEDATKDSAKPKFTVAVYLDDGRVFDYEVGSMASAREHTSAIIATGYRSVQEDEPNVMTHYPPHRISKVKITSAGAPVTTNYTDRVRGT
jgi:hypothetical protein